MSRLVALLALLVNSAVSAQTASSPAVITLERTACFGECPVYQVEISADGEIRYTGISYVRVVGPAAARVEPDAVAKLVAEFTRAGYVQFADRYEFIRNADGTQTTVTDLPTTITSLRVGSQVKRVVDYVGAPTALRELEARIDAVAGTQRWVSVTPDVVAELERGGWNAAGDDGAKWLRQAVERGDADTVQALVDAHGDPNATTIPPLVFARDPKMIRLLVARGADVNGRTAGGDTILMAAVHSRRADCVAALLAAGARADAINRQTRQTALQLAVALANEPPPPPFPGDPPEPHDEAQIVALLRAAGAK